MMIRVPDGKAATTVSKASVTDVGASGRGGGSGGGGGGGSSGRGGYRVPDNINGWLPSEVNRFTAGLGRCGTLYANKVATCFERNKLDLQLSSNILQDIQNVHAINTGGCPGCRPCLTANCYTSSGGGTSPATGHSQDDDDAVPVRKRAFRSREGVAGDGVEMMHTVEEQATLQATDKDLRTVCECFAKAFRQTINECKLNHVMCKTPQTCSPVGSCPLVQPSTCSPKSDALGSATPTYSCDVDYCTEGTGTCRHQWWATATNLPAVPATCGDEVQAQAGSNHEEFALTALCNVLRPNKRSTTYTVFLTTTSVSPVGLSAGAIAGIVIGSLLVLVVVVAGVVFLLRRKNATEY